MQKVNEYLAIGQSESYKRMNREAFLFQLINHMDYACTPDSLKGDDVAETRQHWTIVEKRRIRNAIFRAATKYVNDWNATHDDKKSVDDYDVLTDAFFGTSYGADYQSSRGSWDKASASYIKNIESWDTGDACLVSPYDPRFAESDAFDDTHDEIGYALFDDVDSDTELSFVHYGVNKAVASATSRSNIATRRAYDLEGLRVKSGYADIAHYITTDKDRKAIADYLIGIESGKNPMQPKHKRFMKEVCEYMTENGISYTLTLKNETELVLKCNGSLDIRLWDTNDEPRYQGRIYDNGQKIYPGLARSGEEDELITTKDRMAVVKWFFGTEPVPFREYNIDGTAMTSAPRVNRNSVPYVGYASILQDIPLTSSRASSTGAARRYVSTARSPRRSDANSSIMLSYVHPGRNKGYDNIVNIMFDGTRNDKYTSHERMFNSLANPVESFYIPVEGAAIQPERTVKWDKFRVSLDPSDILPGDAEKYVDDNGNEKIRVKERIPAEHVQYYTKISTRNLLAEWVQSAKDTHRSYMDLDGLRTDYDLFSADASHKLAASSDADVDALREMYFDFLTNRDVDFGMDIFANVPADKIPDYISDETDLSSLSVDQKMELIRLHYDAYVESEFGNVPKIGVEPAPTDFGFNPEKVARYVNTPQSHSVQRNYDYIRYMLMNLGDYYSQDWLPYDNYISGSMKDALIKYDSDNVVASFSLAGISNGFLFEDPKTNTVVPLLDKHGNITKNTLSVLGRIRGNDVEALAEKPVSFDMMMHVARTLAESGCDISSIKVSIDNHGIIHYEGSQYTQKNPTVDMLGDHDKLMYDISGDIGQIFEPDKYGAIYPESVTPSSDVFIPGYSAYLVPDDIDNPQDIRDRLRLVGWQKQLKQEITHNIHNACFQDVVDYGFYPHSACLNRVYKRMYDMSFNKTFYEMHLPKEGQSEKDLTDEQKTFLAVIETMKGRCKFPSEYDENATTMAQSYIENPEQEAAQKFDWYYSDLCNNENLRVMSPVFDGVFDPDMTGTAKNQGIVRYLAMGVVVDTNTNKVVDYIKPLPGQDPPETALMADPLFANKMHDTWDRRQMSASQIPTAWHTPRHVGAAMMTIDGWGFDDGFVVSKKFAEKYPVPVLGTKGLKSLSTELRPLTVQDKLSNMGGNKGVIGLVVDPDLASDVISNTVIQYLANTISTDDNVLSVEDLSMPVLLRDLRSVQWTGPDGKPVKSLNDISSASCNILDKEFDIVFDESDSSDHYVQFAKHIQNQLFLDTFDMDESDVANGFTFTYNDVTYDMMLDSSSKSTYVEQLTRHIQKENHVEGLDHVMHLFADNPELDVVMAPYSGMSRGNASSILSLMGPDRKDIVKDDGTVLHNALGYTDLIVVDMLADVKTHVYGADETETSSGRKASAQLAWALASKGAKNIMNEFYGGNGSALDDIREYAICIGLDFNEKMQPVLGYHPQEHRNEKRRLIKMPAGKDLSLVYRKDEYYLPNTTLYGKNDAELSSEIVEQLNVSGGFMELPFPLQFNIDSYVSDVPFFKQYIKDHGLTLQKTGQTYTDGVNTIPTYGMPVLSSMLRSGQEFVDGTLQLHDYTRHYVSIYKNAALYTAVLDERNILNKINKSLQTYSDAGRLQAALQKKVASFGDVKTKESEIYTSILKSCTKGSSGVLLPIETIKESFANRLKALDQAQAEAVRKAQASFDTVVSDIVENRFDTKYNVVREKVMAKRINKSGSMVWSADPRLKSDEVAMSEEQARKLFGKDFDPSRHYSVLLWRDPILRDGGLRYMDVVINNNLKGCAVNPLMDISFDGDFDGDSVGVVPLLTSGARKEAFDKFAFENNMLDYGKKVTLVHPETGEECDGYPLFIQSGQDRAANEVARDSDGNILFDENGNAIPSASRKQIELLEWNINVLEENVKKYEKGELTDEDFTYTKKDRDGNETILVGTAAIKALRHGYKIAVDKWMKTALSGIGTDYINLESTETVIRSLQNIVDDKGKGSASKMDFLCSNLGVTYERDENGRVKYDTIKEYRDENGNLIPQIVAEQGYDAARQFDNRVQETVAYKADNTSLGGLFSQRGTVAFRDSAIKELLELTYPVTQSILQSKHDPIDAKVKDKIARFWGMDCWNGYKLTGDWSENMSADDIIKQHHHKIKIDVINPLTKERIPVKEYDPVQQKYVPKVDANGKPVYEQTYKKCSREEWIAQMKGMFKAMNVDINPDYITRLADLMLGDREYTVKSSINNRDITYVNPESKTYDRIPLKWRNKICGIDEFAKKHGALLDRMGYTEKFSALVYTACMSDEEYRDYITTEKHSGYLCNEVSDAPTSTSLLGNAAEVAHSIGEAHRADIMSGSVHSDQESAVRDTMTNSALFAPDTFIDELYGDVEREKTHSDKNEFVKKKRGEIINFEKAPRAVGRSDCLLSQKDLDAGATYMFESDGDYKARLDKIRQDQIMTDLVSEGMVDGTEDSASKEESYEDEDIAKEA